MSTRNIQSWVREEDQDTRYNESLLSPEVDIKEEKKVEGSVRKPILMKSQHKLNNSMEKNQRLRKVQFEGGRNMSGRKEQTGKKNDEVKVQKVQSAVKQTERGLRSSQRKEKENVSA